MSLPDLHDVPTRLVTGGYILHAGLQKWSADEGTATALHGMAANAYPFLASVPPQQFVKLLSAGEITVGSLLLVPLVSNRLAGLALTAFSGGLLGMYWRTEALHEPGSIWPTQAGTAVSKDVWMAGIGVGLLMPRRLVSRATAKVASALPGR